MTDRQANRILDTAERLVIAIVILCAIATAAVQLPRAIAKAFAADCQDRCVYYVIDGELHCDLHRYCNDN